MPQRPWACRSSRASADETDVGAAPDGAPLDLRSDDFERLAARGQSGPPASTSWCSAERCRRLCTTGYQ